MKGVVYTKTYRSLERNELKVYTDKNKGQESKPKRYRGKKTKTNTQGPELKSDTYFKGQYSDLERYIFDLGLISSKKFDRIMKDLERYLGATYRYSCQLASMADIPVTFSNPETTKITPDTGVKRPKIDVDTTYLKKKNIE